MEVVSAGCFKQIQVNVEMLYRAGFRPPLLSGGSPTYDFVVGNSGVFLDVAIQLSGFVPLPDLRGVPW
jgi:hypothetical protein